MQTYTNAVKSLRTKMTSGPNSFKKGMSEGGASNYKKGGYVVKRSSARKGKTHVVIGPDGTKKYFGDSKLGQHPKDPKRKKAFYARHAKNLKNNPYFRAFARKTWQHGGVVKADVPMYKKGGAVQHMSPKEKILMMARGGYANYSPGFYMNF